MKVGLLGAGGIAGRMAETVASMGEAVNYAVASRDLAKAKEFAEKFGVEHAYGSYEEMLNDPEVDLVYVALPHSHHCEWTVKALRAGRNVLCEKSFAANAKQARKMIDVAKETGLLLAEAIWTRYMPSRGIIDEIIKSGEIGEVFSVDSNLGYKIDHVERMQEPALAGGCLLDLGVYTLNFSSMVMGDNIKHIDAHMIPTATGVDGQSTIMLTYENGAMASMFNTMYGQTDRRGLITGRNGFISVWNINNPEKISVFDGAGRLKREILPPPQITGYEYEVLACKRAIEAGAIECPEMPHDEIIEIMEQMDKIREIYGLRFPFE